MQRRLFFSGIALVIVGACLTTAALAVPHGTGKLDLRLENKATVMTAAYKVYGNSKAAQGKYWLGKLTLSNTGDAPLENVAISFQIPNWIPWTTPESYPEILPHQTVVVPFYPKLPASVARITSMTPTSLEVKIDYDDGHGQKSRIEHRDFQFRGVHEIEYSSLPQREIVTFWDSEDNAELNSAWVTEEDPVVRVFYAKASELAGGFGTMQDAKDIEQLAHSTYDLMVALGMTYSGTKGVPEKKGDEYVLVQSMRLPRDVIIGNTGLCVELAQLWCSIAINAGAGCYLVQIPGHAFPVLRAGDGSLLAVESTAIGGAFEGGNLGRAATFEQAMTWGAETFGKVSRGETPAIFVDVLAYRDEGIRPPELPDVDRTTVLKQMDGRLREHQQAEQREVERDRPREDGRLHATGAQSWKDPRERVALRIPAGWRVQENVMEQVRQTLPGYALSIINPNTRCGSEVIFFDGAENPEQAVQTWVEGLQRIGATIELGEPRPDSVTGHRAVDYEFQMQIGQTVIGGIISIVQIRGGLVAFTLGGPTDNLQAAMPEFQQLVQSIQFAR